MKDVELREDEIICPICNGRGHTNKNIYVCEKCDGSGKVDWVSNVVTHKRKQTDLNRLSVRRLVIHLQSLVNQFKFEPLDDLTLNALEGSLKNYISMLYSRKAINNYKITKNPNNMSIDLTITPQTSKETININYKLEYIK